MSFTPTLLDRAVSIVDKEGRPTFAYQRAWEEMQQGIYDAILAIPGVEAAIIAAQAAADAANTAAGNADTAAQQAAADASLASSGITPANVLSATDVGASATINIAAHTRVYGNGTSVSVSSGAISGLAYATTYYVYYDQPSRLGGAVSYQATTTLATAAQTGNRHSVGAVKTPAAAAGPTTGTVNLPPGVVQP